MQDIFPKHIFLKYLYDHNGSSMTEYALIGGVVSIVAVSSLLAMNSSLGEVFSSIVAAFN